MENNIILMLADLLQQFRTESLQQVREIVRQEIKAEQQQQAGEKLLSVAEAAKLFKPAISRQTLTTWTKDELIPMQKIGGKNFYKQSDILEAGTKLKKYKK